MLAAVVAMVVMIVVVDQVIWRPIVVWAQKYKIEETAETDKPQSWVLSLLSHSRLYNWAIQHVGKRRSSALAAASPSMTDLAGTKPVVQRSQSGNFWNK